MPGVRPEFDVLALFRLEVFIAGEFRRVEKVDALGADGGDEIIEVFR